MKESTPDKRYAFAVALIQRQRARSLDDASDMLIRLVQRMQNTAKEKLQLLQSAHLQQSAGLASTLRERGLGVLERWIRNTATPLDRVAPWAGRPRIVATL
jgi:hypothetical protein